MKTQNDLQMELEKRIIGSMLNLEKRDEQLYYISLIGNSNHFTSSKHQEIIEAFSRLSISEKVTVDQLKLAIYLKKYHKEISEINSAYVSCAFLESDIKTLILRFRQNELIKQVEIDTKELTDSVTLSEIDKAKNQMIIHLSGNLMDSESKFLDFRKMETLLMENLVKVKQSRIDGYSFGISDLDVVTNGILTPKLYTIGALKKAGKTRFVIQTIRELLKQKVPTAFLSLEVPEYEVYKMLKASFIGLDDSQLRSGNLNYLSKGDVEKLKDINFNQDELMIECNNGLNLSDILKRIRKYAQLGAKVIFIDFFQRITHDIKNKVNELEEIAQRLADTTREYDIALFMLSQLSNLAEKETPSLSHLKGTGGLAEASDTIMILDNVYRRTRDERFKDRIDIEITQRYGESGNLSIYADLGKCAFNNYYKKVD